MSESAPERRAHGPDEHPQSLDYATAAPTVPPIDSSIATIVGTVQQPHQPGRVEGLDPAVVATTATALAESLGASTRLQLFRYPNAFARPPPHQQHQHDHHHHHPPVTINKHEPKRACTSLPLYLSKVSVLDVFEVLEDDRSRSDLCSLVPRPGMEYVPLRTPAAETYHYHHVTDQTKSLQDLQNEVAALLEFRDLVIETFPDLKSKMASSAANSTLTGLPSTSSLGSRREWEPGIRIRRKLTPKELSCTDVGGGGGGGSSSSIGGSGGGNTSSTTIIPGTSDGPVAGGSGNGTGSSTGGTATNASDLNHHHAAHHAQHSSSSLIRSRSNSHSGKKEPKSGEGNNGSVIQDSGFSNETSSSKETHSAASSTSGAVQGTLILPTVPLNRLAAETGGELWNLLDVIHRKSSRIREEVEQHLERERTRGTTNLAISNHHASALHHRPHHHHHHPAVGAAAGGPDDNNIIIHHSNPAAGGSSGTALVASVPVVTSTSNSSSSNNSSGSSSTITTTTTVVVPGKGYQQPGGRISTGALHADGSGTEHDVQILRKERDRLLDKLSEYEAEKVAGCIQMAKMQEELDALTRKLHEPHQLLVANSQKRELNSKLHDLHLQTVNISSSSSPETVKQPTSTTASKQQQTSPQLLKTLSRHRKSSQQDEPVEQLGEQGLAEACDDHPASAPDGVDARAAGFLDGFLGMPWVPKVRTLDSKKIAAILLETNVVGLQRHLLTMTVQNQILQQRLEQAARSRMTLKEKLEKSKEDVDDLRFQLKEKSIELEGTKAQLRVIESKSTSKSVPTSTVGSPERIAPSASPPPPSSPMLSSSHHLPQHHHPHHHHHHHHHHPHMMLALRGESAPRLQSSQVSTPSMKAMTPVAMDDIGQHNSNTESAQEQPDRDGSLGAGRLPHQTPPQQSHHHHQQQQQQQQPPETPRRRPSKIPLPGTKGSAAPKPPTGRNFSATPTPTTPTGTPSGRPLGSGGASSGPPSNRSLTKSTSSLYVKSTDAASSFGAPQPPQPMARTRDTTAHSTSASSSGSLYHRADSALSWRTGSKDTPSLEKSRSSSIPVSAAGGGKGTAGSGSAPPSSPATSTKMAMPPPPVPPVPYGGIVCSSPQPRAKRDNLTSKVKNCDSLSRLQSAQVSTYGVGSSSSSPGTATNTTTTTNTSTTACGQLSKSGSRKELSSSPGSAGERKASTGGGAGIAGLRHPSTVSIGSTGQSDDSATVIAATAANAAGASTASSNVKTRRNNTFRLVKPTLTPLVAVADHANNSTITSVGILSPPPPLPGITPSPDTYASSLRAIGRVRSRTATGGATTATTSPGSTNPGVRPACSTSALSSSAGRGDEKAEEQGLRRDLIGEYLAAKSRANLLQKAAAVPPPIFHVAGSLVLQEQQQQLQQHREYDELAYKHPALLMDASEDEEEEEHLPPDGDADSEEQNAGQESLIVPSRRKRLVAFQPKDAGKREEDGTTAASCCRLVGKVNPNILKTWEQLLAGGGGGGSGSSGGGPCAHQQRAPGDDTGGKASTEKADGSLVLDSVRSDGASDEPDERQSCLLYCPQRDPYGGDGEEHGAFTVNRLRHPNAAPSSITTTVTTTRNSSDGGADFYDSIDAVSECVRAGTGRPGEHGESYAEQAAIGGGEALAELTSLDRKRLLWSIAIE